MREVRCHMAVLASDSVTMIVSGLKQLIPFVF
jgi:hypothetical protein